MAVYKISGYAQHPYITRDGELLKEPFQGHFVQHENDEIIGRIEWERECGFPYSSLRKGFSFIKGLFVDKTKLIFVEMTDEEIAKGFCFENINEKGYHDYEEDFLGGLFCGDTSFWATYISVEEVIDSDETAENLETGFRRFCEGLSDGRKRMFKHVQKLRDLIR